MKIFGTDYDGVIINIEPQKSKAFGDLLNKERGISKETAEKFWIETGGTSRRYKFDYFYNKQFGNKLSDDVYSKIESEFSNLLKEKFYPSVKILPYSLDLLKFARSHFDYLFISSGIPREELKYLVELNGLSKYFNLILGTNKKYKSKTDHFIEIIQTQKPDLLIFVADSAEDMKVAKQANAISIGIPTNHTESELFTAGAKYVCEIQDAVGIIDKLI